MIPVHERTLVALEQQPWSSLYRAMIGYVLVVSFGYLNGSGVLDWQFIVVFVVALLALRVGTLIARKLLPFSSEVQQIWLTRRQLSKEYDSYQWQKLLWFGMGMVGALSSSGVSGGPGYALTGFCLVSGAIGGIFWQCRVRPK